ncbi:MAG: hypothetical protein ACYS7Y_20295 [Planctomycetota bacterium]|jgi:hypothetical protein
METTISPRAIGRLVRTMHHLSFGCGVPLDQIKADTPMATVREILGHHDDTGRLSAQLKQALVQGAV